MAALNRASLVGEVRASAAEAAWELRRLGSAGRRRWGILIVLAPAALVAAAATLWFATAQQQAHDARRALADRARSAPALPPAANALAEGKARIRDFDDLLPEYEDTPDTVADVLGIARRAGVSIKRGEYKSIVDPFGGFLRYQMALPVNGEPAAVVGFMRQAMLEHRTLTVESVRFARPQADSRQVEARVQWTLLTKLPRIGGSLPAGSRVAAQERPRTTP